TDLEVRKLIPEHDDASQSLLCGDIAGGSHHDVRFYALVAARRFPSANPLGAMGDGLVHGQVLKVHLLITDDYVDVVLTPQAVIGNGQQSVDVRRQVNPGNSRALVQDHVKETGILMGKAVVVLPPDGGGNQDVQ